jgi:hypothetical protein
MKNSLEHVSVPGKIEIGGRVFRPGNKVLLESLPADIVREMARREMEKIEAAGQGYFPQLHQSETDDAEAVTANFNFGS